MNPFSTWNQAEVEAHNARVAGFTMPDVRSPPIREVELHNQILDYCRRRGWIALHGSTACATARTIGEFDFVVLADRGRVFLVEVKTAKGKLTPEQAGMHHWAARLGHQPKVVRSLREFEELA